MPSINPRPPPLPHTHTHTHRLSLAVQQFIQAQPQILQLIVQRNPEFGQLLIAGDPRAISQLNQMIEGYLNQMKHEQNLVCLFDFAFG